MQKAKWETKNLSDGFPELKGYMLVGLPPFLRDWLLKKKPELIEVVATCDTNVTYPKAFIVTLEVFCKPKAGRRAYDRVDTYKYWLNLATETMEPLAFWSDAFSPVSKEVFDMVVDGFYRAWGDALRPPAGGDAEEGSEVGADDDDHCPVKRLAEIMKDLEERKRLKEN